MLLKRLALLCCLASFAGGKGLHAVHASERLSGSLSLFDKLRPHVQPGGATVPPCSTPNRREEYVGMGAATCDHSVAAGCRARGLAPRLLLRGAGAPRNGRLPMMRGGYGDEEDGEEGPEGDDSGSQERF
ncbi:hypothetical protein T484DRAFT_3012293 [Baffinella frigidus]|nr:hypothetical protein T484DRAFT_3012293 [Cryptophyta sp. CCMP2293]